MQCNWIINMHHLMCMLLCVIVTTAEDPVFLFQSCCNIYCLKSWRPFLTTVEHWIYAIFWPFDCLNPNQATGFGRIFSVFNSPLKNSWHRIRSLPYGTIVFFTWTLPSISCGFIKTWGRKMTGDFTDLTRGDQQSLETLTWVMWLMSSECSTAGFSSWFIQGGCFQNSLFPVGSNPLCSGLSTA